MAARGPRLQGILQVDGLHIRRHAAHVDAPRLDRRQLRARCCPEVVEGWVKVGEGYVGLFYDFHRLMHSENKKLLNLCMEILDW